MRIDDLLECERLMLLRRPATRFRVSPSVRGPGQPEPIYLLLPREVNSELVEMATSSGEMVVGQKLTEVPSLDGTVYVVSVVCEGVVELSLIGERDEATQGIEVVPHGKEPDCVARLNTGYFDLELCRGTGKGEGSSKWGLRHFSSLQQGKDLLSSGNNAIGGFYGPFFTPENGLINPPEHTIAHVEAIAIGPVQHRYRLSGTVPDGLLPELRGKQFVIDWVFTVNTPYFIRRYLVDGFETVINGRSVTDKITVGDEFEEGKGAAVFDRFEEFGSTAYREGDPYALRLVDAVERVISGDRLGSNKLEEISAAIESDINGAHWDLYWRLFSFWERVLPEEELKRYLAEVRALAHVQADSSSRPWITSTGPIDVSSVSDATIFAGPADKSAEFSTETGYTMVWWTSQPSGAFQIVQRKPSGWVNWGTNGENECPELPVGVDIKTAYGPYGSDWQGIAQWLEKPPKVEMGS